MWGCVALLATGLGWLVGHDWWPQETPFGPQPHPGRRVAAARARRDRVVRVGRRWRRLAGARAPCLAAPCGGGRSHRRRLGRALQRSRRTAAARTASGALVVLALAVLLGSAIGLQYAPEGAHAWLSTLHWVLGVALSVMLLWHWIVRLRH